MKRGFALFFLAILFALVPSTVYADHVISNDKLVLRFHEKTGALIFLSDSENGTNLLDYKGYPPFLLGLDTRTTNLWHAEPNKIFGPEDNSVLVEKISPEMNNGAPALVFRYSGVGGMDIRVVARVELRTGERYARFSLEVVNNSASVVATTVFPVIGDLPSGDRCDLAWPKGRGEIHRNPPADFFESLAYPGPASMQWFHYSAGPAGGVYLAALDNSAAYKEFRFGKDPLTGAARGASITSWPFVAREARWRSPDILLGRAFSWYEPAGVYRKWLVDEAGWTKERPLWVEELAALGWLNVKKGPGGKTGSYDEIPELAATLNRAGVGAVCVSGWHEAGLGDGYPDYSFIENAGGRKALEKAITAVKDRGGRVVFTMNTLLAGLKSDFAKTYAGSCVSRKRTGESREVSTDRGRFIEMCPHCREWVDKLALYQENLRDMGADGMCFFAAGSGPARLCYGKKHGHETPGLAFGAGLDEMLGEFLDVWSGRKPGPGERRDLVLGRKGPDRNYVKNPAFFTEGVLDALGGAADLQGVNSGAPFGADDNDAPELAAFTLPCRLLGLPDARNGENGEKRFTRAFLLGSPVLGVNEEARKVAAIYREASECFLRGRFLHRAGGLITPETADYSVFLSRNRESVVAAFYNPSDRPFSGKLILFTKPLGVEGSQVKAYCLGANEKEVKIEDRKEAVEAEVKIPARGIAAIKFEFR